MKTLRPFVTLLLAWLIAFPVFAGPIDSYPVVTPTGPEKVIGTQSGVTVNMTTQSIANLAVVDPTRWGAKGDGVTDDSAAVQAAINATAGGILYTGSHVYAMGSGVTIASPMKIIGCHSNVTCGFKTLATNLTLFTITAQSVEIDGVFVNNSGPGVSTSGAMFSVGPSTGAVYIHDSYIEQPCFGVDLAGVVNIVERNTFNDTAHSGCAAIRVGAATTGGGTIDPKIVLNTIGPKSGTPATYGIEVLDAGGSHILFNTFSAGFTYGTALVPGVSQVVQYMFAEGELGDTDTLANLYINPSAASGLVFHNNFVNAWANGGAAVGVLIQNTSAGLVSGNHFTGSRVSGNGTNGVQVDAGTDFSFVSGSACANSGSSAGTYYNFLIASGLAKVRVQDNTIGDACDGLVGAAGSGAGIHFAGATTETNVSNNDFSAQSNAFIDGTLPSDMPFTSHLCGNTSTAGGGASGIIKWTVAWTGCDTQAPVTLGNTATQNLPIGSGLVTFTDISIGTSGTFLISGGSVTLVSAAGPTFVASASPTASQVGLSWSGSLYQLKTGSAAGGIINAAMTLTRNAD